MCPSRIALFVFACLFSRITLPPKYPHGTVVFTLAVKDGFVMAADGKSLIVAESNSGISERLLVAA